MLDCNIRTESDKFSYIDILNLLIHFKIKDISVFFTNFKTKLNLMGNKRSIFELIQLLLKIIVFAHFIGKNKYIYSVYKFLKKDFFPPPNIIIKKNF